MNARQLGTVLAALRTLQLRAMGGIVEFPNNSIEDIATVAGEPPLTIDEIDALCEELNRAAPHSKR